MILSTYLFVAVIHLQADVLCNGVMMKKIVIYSIIVCLLFISCSKEETQKSREAWVNNADGEIVFGMSYPITEIDGNTDFIKGVNMAVEEINKKGVLGKTIRIQIVDDEAAVTTGAEVAQSFVDDPKISAVIGHWNSRISNAVAEIYNSNGMVMITPASTSPDLTEKGYEYIFSMINDDIDYGGVMARYASESGLDKVAVYYAEDDYGRGLANAFEDEAYEYGVAVIDRTTSINSRNIQDYIDEWTAFDYNAIFIADVMSSSMEVIELIRDSGIDVPIMGATGIDRSSFIETMGTYGEGITMPAVFNATIQSAETRTFVETFEKTYGYTPDTWAAQGYETVKILCQAIETADSAMPNKIAKALSNIENYHSVLGNISCNSKGQIIGKDIYVKAVRNNNYIFLGTY